MKQLDRSSIVILSVSLAVLSGIVAAWWPDIAFALALEDSPLAWLQSSLLVACGSAAGMRAMIVGGAELRAPAQQQWLWSALALLLVLAALDERFMGHERIQEFLLYDLLGGYPAMKHWTQALTGIYGVAGIVALAFMRRAMTCPAWRWCRAGVGVGLLAILLDVAVDSVNFQIIEEVLEATAETLFLCGLFKEVGSAACRPR